MPHHRSRAIESLIRKRLRLWPVLGVVGVRQSGKSTLLRDILGPTLKAEYRTFDSASQRTRAQEAPDSFCERVNNQGPLIIDEIQKVPKIFDALKFHIDARRRPGMYLVSGSTEFSGFFGIRESLTGRIGIIHLYPMTLSEIHQCKLGAHYLNNKPNTASIPLKDFDRHIETGGMPGMCFLRSRDEREASMALWVETTCFRDLPRAVKGSVDGELALDILREVARNDTPSLATLSRKLGKDARIVSNYLAGFVRIFVLIPIPPHPAGVGKTEYVLCDSGLAKYLGAGRPTLLRTHVIHESLATLEASVVSRPRVRYYRNEKTARIPIILEFGDKKQSDLAIAICDRESVTKRDTMTLTNFHKRAKGNHRLLVLSQTSTSYTMEKVEIRPLRG